MKSEELILLPVIFFFFFVIDDLVSFPLLLGKSSEFTGLTWCFGPVFLSPAVSSYDEFLKIEMKPGSS